MYLEDTIAAVSTPVGEGGIGVIRISGSEALPILSKVFRRTNSGGFQSHRFYYGKIVSPQTAITVDEALAVYMQAPRSFTREDVVEIQCHSGTLIIQQVLSLVLLCGARLAEPGEFTRRAFLNGRIDLLQAEAVIDMIRAKTETAVAVARQQFTGALSDALFNIRDIIRNALALIEAYVDFPDEDMAVAESGRLFREIQEALAITTELINSFDEGKVIREGVNVLIAGKPNVGKSSLLNALLKEKRAIVTAIPGTTRDLIEEVINIDGLPVKLLDTAGIRVSDDPIEREGIALALDRVASADLILFMLDTSRPFDANDRLVAESIAHARIVVVLNKSDLDVVLELPASLRSYPVVSISTFFAAGIDQLKHMISQSFLHGKVVDSRDSLFLSRSRHRDALLRVRSLLKDFLDHSAIPLPDELLALDLREALDALGQVTGETTPDDILDLIFGQFCIGK
jgi:tRNA modification GTPase